MAKFISNITPRIFVFVHHYSGVICFCYMVGLGSFSKPVVTCNHVGGSFNFFKYQHWGCLNNTIFQILDYVLHAEHISCVIMNCCQQQWFITFLFLMALGGLAVEKSLSFVRKMLFQVAFLMFFSIAIYFCYFLLVSLSIAVSSCISTQYNGDPIWCVCFCSFCLKSIVPCTLHGIYVREDNFKVYAMITLRIWITLTLLSVVRERLLNWINHLYMLYDYPHINMGYIMRFIKVYICYYWVYISCESVQ